MNPNIDWSQFEPVEAQEDVVLPQKNEIDWNQFEAVNPPEKPKEKRYDNRIEYLRKQGVSEEDIAQFEAENAGVEFEGSKQALKELPRGLLSGITAGYSELIPGFEPEGFAGGTAKLIGSLAPIGLTARTISVPLKLAASKSPVIRQGLISFAELIGLSTAGGLYGGLEESAEKTKEKKEFVAPSLESVIEHGSQWALLDGVLKAVGWTGRFGKALAEKVFKSGKPAEQIMEDLAAKIGNTDKVAEKAISILENKPLKAVEQEIKLSSEPPAEKTELLANEEFSSRVKERGVDLTTKKVSPKTFESLEKSEAVTPTPYLPAEIESEVIAEESLNDGLNQQIEQISPRAATQKELGENVQKEIEATVKEQKKKTDDLYKIAKEVEEGRAPRVKKTADAIVEEIKKIEAGGINLTPEGYNKARKQLMDTLTDLGYGVETGKDGLIVRAIQSQRQPLSKVVEVKRRLNNIINYDLIDTSAQDFLKNPAAQLRAEIRSGYGPKNSKARKAFEKAEKEFGEFAEKKGKQSIRNIRNSEKPESVASIIRTPSGLADLKEVVSPQQFSQIERELLEYLRGQKEENAAKLYRELRPSLSSDARSIAEQIIESKAPKASPLRKAAQREALQKKVIDDLSQATLTGQRPKVALDLWKTKEGQQLIKQFLEKSPNKKEILKYLQDQSFKDFSSSVINPDGKVNFKKLNEMLKDPATVVNLRLVAGEEGVNFLRNLEKLSNQIEKNTSILERTISKGSAPERKKIKEEIEKLGKERIENIKKKNTAPTPEEKIFQSKFDEEALKEREEVQASLKEKGKERFRKLREIEDQKNKSGIMYKIDDLVNSYGWKGKGVLAALGIWKIGTIEGLSLAAGYEIINRLAKNKPLQDAIKRAAVKPRNNLDVIRSINGIQKAMEATDR